MTAGASLSTIICGSVFVINQSDPERASAAASVAEAGGGANDLSLSQEKQLMLQAMRKVHRRQEKQAASRNEQRKPLETGQYWFGVHHALDELNAHEKYNARLFYVYARQKGFSNQQVGCGDDLLATESHFNEEETNASSGAYGATQALPADKMAEAGADWRTNVVTQFRWLFDYYLPSPSHGYHGDPCEAEAHSLAYGWY